MCQKRMLQVTVCIERRGRPLLLMRWRVCASFIFRAPALQSGWESSTKSADSSQTEFSLAAVEVEVKVEEVLLLKQQLLLTLESLP
jgi:hypothetical protein